MNNRLFNIDAICFINRNGIYPMRFSYPPFNYHTVFTFAPNSYEQSISNECSIRNILCVVNIICFIDRIFHRNILCPATCYDKKCQYKKQKCFSFHINKAKLCFVATSYCCRYAQILYQCLCVCNPL